MSACNILEINMHRLYIAKQVFETSVRVGIPSDEIKNLSEPFYRASNVGKTKGTSFGFSIVKRFVSLHKGQISIESVLDQGTKVIITLP